MERLDVDPLNGEEESGEIKESKENLRAAARAADPIKPLRDHPFLTVGVAAALGASMASPVVSEWLWTTFQRGVLRATVAAGRRILARGTPSPAVQAPPPAPVIDHPN